MRLSKIPVGIANRAGARLSNNNNNQYIPPNILYDCRPVINFRSTESIKFLNDLFFFNRKKKPLMGINIITMASISPVKSPSENCFGS